MVAILALGGCQAIPSRLEAAGVTKITLWQGVNPPPNRDVLQVLVDRFNRQNQDIQVDSLYVGQAEQQIPKIILGQCHLARIM